jgi:hypothetical protein
MPKQIEEQIERLCKQQSENKRLEQTMNATEADLAQVSLTHTHMSATEADLAQVSLPHTHERHRGRPSPGRPALLLVLKYTQPQISGY